MSEDSRTRTLRTGLFIGLGVSGVALSVYLGNHYGDLVGILAAIALLLFAQGYSATFAD